MTKTISCAKLCPACGMTKLRKISGIIAWLYGYHPPVPSLNITLRWRSESPVLDGSFMNKMSEIISIPEANEMKNGDMTRAKMGGNDVLVGKYQDKFYGVARYCTHAGGDLSQGELNGYVLTCPVHGSQFDIRDGRVIRWTRWPGWISWLISIVKPEKPLAIYEVQTSEKQGSSPVR